MSRYFIEHPVFAWVIAILIVIAGGLSIRSLGVESYPNIAPTQVVVSAGYPGANAETMSDIGATTSLPSQAVRIDSESFPTGIETPSAGHRSSATAFTVSNSAASSPGWPAAAIQLAESLVLESSAPEEARLVRASPTAMRPDAGASISASGVRSPMAKASPA